MSHGEAGNDTFNRKSTVFSGHPTAYIAEFS